MINIVTCKIELGAWTVRINGHFVADFYWFGEKRARRLAMNIGHALNSVVSPQ